MTSTIVLVFYRCFVFGIGAYLAHLGYRLFTLGIFNDSGDLEATWGDNKLLLKKAAPGTFFVVAGVLVIGMSLLRPIKIEDVDGSVHTECFSADRVVPDSQIVPLPLPDNKTLLNSDGPH